MPNRTTIEWCDYTSNPIVPKEGGWGCTKVSAGCDHCYAERLNMRLGNHRNFTGKWEFVLKEKELEALERLKPGNPSHRIFMCDMGDLFHSNVPWEFIVKVFNVMACTPWHTYIVLTKRPGGMAYFANKVWPTRGGRWEPIRPVADKRWPGTAWPSNVWAGTSVEAEWDGNKHLIQRLDLLAQVPARVRFVSCEPLIGPLDLEPWLGRPDRPGARLCNWVIVGGESGGHARPMDIQWARDILQQCQAAGIACFVKQLGSHPILNGNEVTHPFVRGQRLLVDRKGGDPSEWPADLRVREYPGRGDPWSLKRCGKPAPAD